MGFKLSIEQGKGRGQAFDFDAETITIGRTEENDVVLYEQGVSRKHARIVFQGGKHFVEDLDSANGTLLNGAKVKKEALKEGDTVGIGAVVFRFAESKGGSKSDNQARIGHGEKTPAPADGATAKGPAPTAPPTKSAPAVPVAAAGGPAKPPVFNPRFVVMGVAAALIFAIGYAAWNVGKTTNTGKPPCPTDPIRLEGQSISSMVFSTTAESVCTPGKQISFGFLGQPRTKYLLSYSSFYTERNGIEVLINGEKYKEGSPLATTRRSKPTEVMIEDKQVKVGNQENVITFKTDKKQWGLERIELTPVPLDGCSVAQAQEYFQLGNQLYEQKNVAAPNLYHSMQYLKKSRQCLEAIEPKPPDYTVVKQLLLTVDGELDSLCEHKLFYVKKQQTFGKFEAANDGYRYLLTAFPEDEHPCRSRVYDALGGPQRVKTILGASL